jgi:ADP-ribosyl-[dinitrogen reductase] hydrolase
LLLRADPLRAQDLAADASRTTQQAPIVLDLCRVWAAQFIDALNGTPKEELTAYQGPTLRALRQRMLKPRVKVLLDGTGRVQADPDDALSVTEAAVRSFAATNTFRDALLNVATSRTPSAAALCGALSGAHYGVESIPLDWRKRITEEAALRSLAHHLLG